MADRGMSKWTPEGNLEWIRSAIARRASFLAVSSVQQNAGNMAKFSDKRGYVWTFYSQELATIVRSNRYDWIHLDNGWTYLFPK
jgi:hypothetical protein